MKTYNLVIIDSEGETIYDVEISADEVIGMLVKKPVIVGQQVGAEGYDHPVTGPVEEPTKKKRGEWHKKACCGSMGPRHKKTCTQNNSVPKATPKKISVEIEESKKASTTNNFPVLRSTRQRVQELFDAGLIMSEVAEEIPDVPIAELTAVYRDIESKSGVTS